MGSAQAWCGHRPPGGRRPHRQATPFPHRNQHGVFAKLPRVSVTMPNKFLITVTLHLRGRETSRVTSCKKKNNNKHHFLN